MAGKTVWVTGGSGLLGSRVVVAFREAGWQVAAPAHAEADLTDEACITRLLDAIKPDLIVNCAAQRRPDCCESASDEVLALNVLLPKRLAQAGIPLVHISTDYVFNGTNAPYEADAPRRPLNAYGRQKAAAEAELEGLAHVLILRVAILYGMTTNLANSPVTVLAANLLKAQGAPVLMDDLAVRYPTFTDDIARQILALVPRIGAGVHGIFQYTGEEPMTKYLMAIAQAPLVGCDPRQCLADTTPTRVPRPYDCHLSVRKLQQLGCYVTPTPFAQAIRRVLQAHG